MPVYRAKCEICGQQEDVFRSVSRYDDLPDCCGSRMRQVICAAYVTPDIEPYRSMVTGEYIGSRSTHAQHLRAHNCVELGHESVQRKESYVETKRDKQKLREFIGGQMSERGMY